jgi:Fic family protein
MGRAVFRMTSEYVHESNLIEGIDSKQADKDMIKAWEKLKTRLENGKKPLTNDIIRQLQDDITRSQDMNVFWRGVYRDRNKVRVSVAGRLGADPDAVGRLMDEWLANYQSMTPQDAHIAFERIHPFADGNGRTGRMLMWLQEYLSGQRPTLIRYQDRAQYYQWFDEPTNEVQTQE